MSSVPLALQHLYAKMKPEVSAAVSGRIFYGVIPTSAPKYPLVLIQTYAAGRDVRFNGQTNPIAMTLVDMQVRVVADITANPNPTSIFELYDLIHSKIDGTTGTYQEGLVLDCSRYETADMEETDNGKIFMYHGGRYMVSVR